MRSLLTARIPTLLGLVLLICGVGGTLFLNNSKAILHSNASVDQSPRDIRITNVTDTTITVSYMTPSSVLGTVYYGETTSPKAVALDDRDLGKGIPMPHVTHYFTLTDLRQDTPYYFTILSGGTTYLHEDKPFTARTARIVSDKAPNLPQFSGTIVMPNDAPANEVVLYLQSDTSQPVSTLVRPDTSYVISLANLRTSDTASYDTLTKESILHLLFVSQSGQSTVSIRAGQKSPLPAIVLSKNYDFTYAVPTPQLTLPAERFPETSTKAVNGAKTVALPKSKTTIVAIPSPAADTTVLGARDSATPLAETTNNKISFAALPNPDTHSSGNNNSPLLLNGILGSIALAMGIFIISFIRRVTS